MKSTKCLRLPIKLSVEKLFLPIDVPILPSLSCLTSTNPDLISVPWTRPFSKIIRVRTTSNSELIVKIISISSTVGNET